jgi:hypothetical protein
MNEQLQKMLDELPQKKYAKLSDKRLEYIEISKHKIFSNETRNKISEKNKGKKLSDEHKRKLSEKKHSEETKNKISEKKRGVILSEETKKKMSDKIISDETKKKMSDKRKGMKFSDEHKTRLSEKKMKPIIMYTYPKMNFIQEFNSIYEASINLKLNRNYICKRLLGMIKNPGDFTFKYKN